MMCSQLLDAIHKRNTFVPFCNAFRQIDLDVIGRGWASTRSKIEDLLSNHESSEATKKALAQVYLDNLLYTHKAVMLWSIKREVARELVAKLDEFVDPGSPYFATYPLPLPEDKLKQPIALGVPTAVHHLNDSHTIVFASKRSIAEEVRIPLENVPLEYQDAGFTEVVGKRYSIFPVFDSITVTPDRGLVEMRIDLAKGMSEKDILKYRDGIRHRFNSLAREIVGVQNLLGDGLNLVEALIPLYLGKNWTVQRIGHVNEGGYINSNRGRHRIDDVRVDAYHKNGEAAVDHLELWCLNAVFKSRGGYGAPILILEGHSSMLSKLHPYMDIARILDCSSEEDYKLVMGTLLSCISSDEDKK